MKKKKIPLRQKVPNSFEFENISRLMGTFFGSSAHFMLKIITDYRELRSEFEATMRAEGSVKIVGANMQFFGNTL